MEEYTLLFNIKAKEVKFTKRLVPSHFPYNTIQILFFIIFSHSHHILIFKARFIFIICSVRIPYMHLHIDQATSTVWLVFILSTRGHSNSTFLIVSSKFWHFDKRMATLSNIVTLELNIAHIVYQN